MIKSLTFCQSIFMDKWSNNTSQIIKYHSLKEKQDVAKAHNFLKYFINILSN